MARCCFSILIQSELDSCREQCNSHYFRKSVFNEVFGGTGHYIFFPNSNAGDNSSLITQKDMDVISNFINEYYCERDKDDTVFIDYCDYVSCELNIPLRSKFHVCIFYHPFHFIVFNF